MNGPTLIKTGDLARALGVTPGTVSVWAHTVLADAWFRRGWFKVEVLRKQGLLPTPEPETEILPHA